MPAVAPNADAAADVDDLEAGALEDRGGEAAAFAAAADRRDRAITGQLVEAAGEVAVGDVERAGDVLPGVLGVVADVKDDRAGVAVDAARQLVGVDQLDPAHRPFLRAPGGHPALEETADREADRGEQLRGGALVAAGGGDHDDV